MIHFGVAINLAQQQVAGPLPHQPRLVLDGRELGRHIACMFIVSESDECHVIRNTKPELLDGCEGRKGDDVVERQQSIRTVWSRKHVGHIPAGHVVVNQVAHDERAVDCNLAGPQSLQIAMLPTAHHVEMIGASDEGNAPRPSSDEVLGGLLSRLVAVSHHT